MCPAKRVNSITECIHHLLTQSGSFKCSLLLHSLDLNITQFYCTFFFFLSLKCFEVDWSAAVLRNRFAFSVPLLQGLGRTRKGPFARLLVYMCPREGALFSRPSEQEPQAKVTLAEDQYCSTPGFDSGLQQEVPFVLSLKPFRKYSEHSACVKQTEAVNV
jgi:hypothetical protein